MSFIRTKSLPRFKPSLTESVSTGIPSLDSLLDGSGLPRGCILCLDQDQNRHFLHILKCVCSEAIYSHKSLLIVGVDLEPILNTLPAPIKIDDAIKPTAIEMENMSIAWQYKHIKEIDTSLQQQTAKTKRPHVFDLGSYLDYQKYIKQNLNVNILKPKEFDQLESLDKYHIVVLFEFGSPLFPLTKLMWLKNAVKESGTIFMSVPSCLQEKEKLHLLYYLSDVVVAMKASSSLLEHQGFFQLLKPLRLPDSLRLNVPETMSLAYKCNKRRFLIEKFHLPPQFEDNDNNNGDFCSKNVDF